MKNKIRLLFKVVILFLKRKVVSSEDIGKSYDAVSDKYNNIFLHYMHCYNDDVLVELVSSFENKSKTLDVLDLASGTGYNSLYLMQKLSRAQFTLVDASDGMLAESKKNIKNATFYHMTMLDFLKKCEKESFDIIFCGWALKYERPKDVVKECFRVLKKDGYMGSIVNTKGTLPEIEKVYPCVLEKNVDKIEKVMLHLPNPKSEKDFDHWFLKNKFIKIKGKTGSHTFTFTNEETLLDFVLSTGALAGYDVMLDFKNKKIRKDTLELLKEYDLKTVTHKYVWGLYKKQETL